MKEKLLKFSNPRNKNWWLFTGALVIFVLAVVLFTLTEEKDAGSLQEYVKKRKRGVQCRRHVPD